MATAASQAAATACASAIVEEVAVEPAGVAQLPTLLANGCSCVVSLLPTATCTRDGATAVGGGRSSNGGGVSGGNGGGSSQ